MKHLMLKLFLGVTGLVCCLGSDEPVRKDPHSPNKPVPAKIKHRLKWDQWFRYGGEDPNKVESRENKVHVFWDGSEIGTNRNALDYLKALKLDAAWEVTFDMPDSPGADGRRWPNPMFGAFLGECDFLDLWDIVVDLKFERKGVPVTTHVLSIASVIDSAQGSNWDNPTWYFDHVKYRGGRVAVEGMKKINWQKGDMLLIIFPPLPLVRLPPEKGSEIQTWLTQLEKIQKVEVIVINNQLLSW